MSKLIFAVTAYLISVISIYAQVSENRDTTSFSKIEVSGNIAVILTENSTFSITVESADQATLKTISTTIKNGTLTITRLIPGLPAKVMLTANSIKKIKVKSNASMRLLNDFTGSKMKIVLHDKAYFYGSLTVDRLSLSADKNAELNVKAQSFYVSGHFEDEAKANISGFASSADLITNSGALCNAKNFAVNDITVKADSVSSVLIQGIGRLNLNTTGDATVTYFGTPEKLLIQSQ